MTVYLKGNKVVLRDLVEDDVRSVYYWLYESEDREHEKWNGPYYATEPKSYEEFRASWQKNLDEAATDETRSLLVIEANGQYIGTVTRYWYDKVTNWIETGIVIHDSRYWSGGYGTEAFDLWIDYLFEHLGPEIVRLGISTWSGNERMMKLAARTGMIIEARIRKARIVEGKHYDSIKMGILREEWEVRKGRNSIATSG